MGKTSRTVWLGAAATAALLLPAAAGLAAEDWYPSKYGADDTIGAANNLSEAGVKRAAGLVKLGKSYALGVPTGPDTPAYPPRWYHITVLQLGASDGATLGSNQATSYDDMLTTYMGVGKKIVYQLIEFGEIRAVKSKGAVLIEKASVDAFRASGKLT